MAKKTICSIKIQWKRIEKTEHGIMQIQLRLEKGRSNWMTAQELKANNWLIIPIHEQHKTDDLTPNNNIKCGAVALFSFVCWAQKIRCLRFFFRVALFQYRSTFAPCWTKPNGKRCKRLRSITAEKIHSGKLCHFFCLEKEKLRSMYRPHRQIFHCWLCNYIFLLDFIRLWQQSFRREYN